ncbi:glycopeptide antibiotics resistance protein [Amycolatopsis echigonensis]|uniref:Glycopeptide antibiotics resistance protein n=1 Tax=Amycolatopsis echigonensis TaxID=2576905 RepID=A0A2N3WMA9_9PSEU|nr:VanZ family protein [Amycolatopsis niigatensis]PKV95007.1 glycopeptide antibiotics resistance protein [Amycolatopsis niigatensis]
MTQWSGPTLIAVFAGFGLAFVLVVPYVAISYRKRGELGLLRAIAAPAFLVYCFALVTYTLLPLPNVDAAYCATHEALRHPVWNPLQFLEDMRQFDTGLLDNPALRQVLFNVAFFVPWGVFLRRLFGRSVGFAIVSGFLVSLAIETTQLTGGWFLMECPYRLFDTGDLLSNTVGAGIGALLAPVVRRSGRLRPDEPRPVLARRRLLGMVLDLISVTLAGVVLSTIALAVQYVTKGTLQNNTLIDDVLGRWVPTAVLLLFVPLAGNGATPGQCAVLLTMVREDGRPPSMLQSIVRFLVGSGGYFILVGLNSGWTSLWLLAHLVFMVFTRGHRGLTGLACGLSVVDTRAADREPVAPPG